MLAHRHPRIRQGLTTVRADLVRKLHQHGIRAKLRDCAGQEIEGACGQLRARAEKLINRA